MDLYEFAGHPAWKQVEFDLGTLLNDYLQRAARARTSDEHLHHRGGLEALEKVLKCLRETRNNMLKDEKG